MNDWSNEESILRDLAIAQGGVPVGDVNVVSSKDKPPAVHIVEETEEQFFQQYAVDASTNTVPDLDLIQEMLHLVRDVRVSEIEDPEVDKIEESNKISHESKNDCKVRSPPRIPKKTVHVNSIQNRNNVIKLIDLIEDQKSKDSSHTDIKMTKEHKIDNGVIPFVVSPVDMFKHKSKKCSDNASTSSNNLNINENSNATQHKTGVYVPTSQAQAYYDTLMEKKRQKELREETIWTRAERLMKENEAKRTKEQEMAAAHH